MWKSLSTLIVRLDELCDLIRESNALTRELIQATTGRPSLVPPLTQSSGPASRPARLPDLRRKFTEKDVIQVTRTDITRQEVDRQMALRSHVSPTGDPVPLTTSQGPSGSAPTVSITAGPPPGASSG